MSRLNQHDQYIREAAAAGTARTHIARSLGVARSTLSTYMDKHQIEVTRAGLPDPTPTGDTVRPSELEIVKEQLREAKAALRKGSRIDVAEERVLQAIELAAAHITPDWIKGSAVEHVARRTDEDRNAHHRQVLLLSDWHGGEVVEPEAVNHRNAYNWEIMLARVDELIAATLSHSRNSPGLTGLDVLFIGDMCSGSNHEELAITNEYPLAEQAVKMGYLQADVIRRLAPHYADIRIGAVVGNHPRLVVKPAAKQVHNNGDWLAATVMAEALKDIDTVSEIVVPKAAALFWEIAGRRMYVWHGDGIKSSMIGVPFGGVMRRTNQIQSQYRQQIHHYVYGHFHSATVVQGGRIIGNGALKGTDEFCDKAFGGGDRPTQLLLTFDEKRERLTDVKYITPTAGIPSAE